MSSIFVHFVNRLREADVSLEPYPHYCLENVFPADYYQLLLKNLPGNDSYENLYEVTTLKLDHFRHRDQRDMKAGWTGVLPPEQKAFWDFKRSAIKCALALAIAATGRKSLLNRN
jgi:hypothetical protein